MIRIVTPRGAVAPRKAAAVYRSVPIRGRSAVRAGRHPETAATGAFRAGRRLRAFRAGLGRAALRRFHAPAARKLGIGHLELRKGVPDRPHLLGVLLLDQRQQRAHALDREPRLIEVTHVLAARGEPEPLATQVHEADHRWEQHVAHRDAPQLLLELRAQLLLARLRVLVAHVLPCPHGTAIAAPAFA